MKGRGSILGMKGSERRDEVKGGGFILGCREAGEEMK